MARGRRRGNNRTKEKKQRMRTEKARMKSSVGATHEVHRSGLLVRRVGGDWRFTQSPSMLTRPPSAPARVPDVRRALALFAQHLNSLPTTITTTHTSDGEREKRRESAREKCHYQAQKPFFSPATSSKQDQGREKGI